MEYFDIIIVGGGASGSFCALCCPQNKKIAIIDAGDKIAKKLLVTGNGKCNISNIDCSSQYFNQNIDSFFDKQNSKQSIKFFEDLGLCTFVDNQRIYPISNTAKSVVDVLNFHLTQRGISCFCNQTVTDIEFDGKKYFVTSDKQKFCAQKVVIATGTNFLPTLKNFDIKISKTFPSLVALKTKQKNKRLEGVRASNCKVTCFCDKTTKTEFGEVLFKSDGLSGICILNLSCVFARQKRFEGKIVIDLLPDFDIEKLTKILNKNKQIFDNVQNMLCGLFHKEIANEIIFRNHLSNDTPCKSLTEKHIKDLATTINQLDFDVVGCFENNQVVSGGIHLDQLTQNLQSKKYKNLFFCGEICDVDGICGGYNLQWAWTSGYIVGKNIYGND